MDSDVPSRLRRVVREQAPFATLAGLVMLASAGVACGGAVVDGEGDANGDTALAAGAPGAAAGCAGGTWRPGSLEIHHIDLGQADATLVVSPTGRAILIDAGEPRWDEARGAETIGPYVEMVIGCARIDYVLLTHFHGDHVGQPGKGGVWHLVNMQGFAIRKLLHRDFHRFRGDSGGTIERWRDYLAGKHGVPPDAEILRPGSDQIALGPGVTFDVLAVNGAGALRAGDFSRDHAPPSENDYSAAMLVRFGKLDYFLAGDLSGVLWPSPHGYTYHDVETVLARRLPDVDVYRVSHHGSRHSSGPTLLAQIRPEVSIVSAGRDNPYGHPAPAVVQALDALGSVYTTAHDGHVVVRTADGVEYSVAGDLHRAADPPRTDRDRDGYFQEADPDDDSFAAVPPPRGGCNRRYQPCE